MSADGFQIDVSKSLAIQLNHLKKRYSENLKKHERDLEGILATMLAQGSSTPIMTDLYFITHNLAGTAPIHGFHEIARLAEGVERMVSHAFHLEPEETRDMDILSAVDALTEEIRVVVEMDIAAWPDQAVDCDQKLST